MAVLRFWSNSSTIYDCCKVICLILFVLGCSGYTKQEGRFNYNRKTLLFTWLAVCWYVGSLTACVYLKLQDPQVDNLDSLVKSIIYLEVGMSTFTYLATVCGMLLSMKNNLKLYARIQDLDEKLLKEFRCKLNYEKLIKKHLFILAPVITAFMIIIVAAVAQASTRKEFLVHLFFGVAYSVLTGGPHLNCYAQMNMAEILTIRFRLFQQLLTKEVVCSSRLDTCQQVDRLATLISLVQEYHSCIRHINQVYAMCLVLALLHDFTLTTSELYLIIGSSITSKKISITWYVSVFAILPLYKMALAALYCERCVREGEKCFKIIMESECWFPRNTDVHHIVSTCMLWRLDNKTEFLCGTMVLNKKCIFVVYTQIFNYLLILIQFRMTQEMGNQIEKQKSTVQGWIGFALE